MEEIAGIPPNQVGYYAGVSKTSYTIFTQFLLELMDVNLKIVEGCFAFIQFCTVYFWGMVSDRIGRKTVVLTGLMGVMVSVASFGLARNFASM